MVAVLYVLCAATAATCACLLARAYARARLRLLLWSAICFGGLTLNNLLLFIDKVLVSGIDLSLARSATALASVLVLLYGLIWEPQR